MWFFSQGVTIEKENAKINRNRKGYVSRNETEGFGHLYLNVKYT